MSILANISNPTIEEVCQVIGLIVSNFPGAKYGPLHYRSLESDKTQALELNKGDYKSHMQLTNASIAELEWWIENMPTVGRNIVHPNPSIVVQTDASTKGWGAALGNDKMGGWWTSAEATNHINILELLAAFFAFKAFCNNTHHTHVQLPTDNTTAVAYINNMGGSKSPLLNTLAKEISWNWFIEMDIWVSAVHIAGKLNTSVDNESRNFSDKHEWSLSKAYFLEIFSSFPELNIDLFASRRNNSLLHSCF